MARPGSGDLVLKGYGDPSLSSAGLASLARQVAAAGIRRVSGRVLGDESWFDAPPHGPRLEAVRSTFSSRRRSRR